MSLQNTPRLGLPLLQSGQTGPYITLNETIWKLEALVQASVLSRTLAVEPSAPQAGDAYLLPEAATGATWSEHDAGAFLIYWGGYWNEVTQTLGAIVFVADEGAHLKLGEGGWEKLIELQSLPQIGVNATADNHNRLSVSSAAVLFNHAGAGVQTKLNKQNSNDTASLLWQTNWSGRAEFGTNGSDNLSLKVSPDGSRWLTAYEVNRFSGRVKWGRATAYKVPDVVRRRYVASANWKISVSSVDNNWRSICWSAELGLFCAVADSGASNRIMTSPDGINWTTRVSPNDNDWGGVCWSAERGLFCAVSSTGVGNRVMTSPDGIVWTARSSAVDNGWRSVCWSPELGLFCVVAWGGVGTRLMTSPDGIVWTARISAADNIWRSVCWSPELGLFCAVADSGVGNRIMTSSNGIVWTTRSSPVDNDWRSVCWSAELGLFCATAITGTGNRVMTSPDGIVWTARSSAADNLWASVCWSAELGLFVSVAASGTGNRVMTSPDGINWSVGSSAFDNGWAAVCWSPELAIFASVSWNGTGNRVMTSVSANSFPFRS
ncbi:MAG: DUF2793 domain-containing protein [Asticcacaulis sp.]